MDKSPLILASTSQTRRSVLAKAGIAFEAMAPLCDEELEKQNFVGPPQELALHLSKRKALSLSSQHPDHLILGADQTLLMGDQVFSKVQSKTAAKETLAQLSGQTHILQSALAIARKDQIIWTEISEARLTMRKLSPAFISHYIERMGDAALWSVGCYQIENEGIQLFEKIEGDHYAILGMPLLGLLSFLRVKAMLPQ